MRQCVMVLGLMAAVVLAGAQDKPRVFVRGKGSENVTSGGGASGGHHWATFGSRSTIDSHDESMEVTKDLQKNCDGVTVTINDANADYIVMLNRESKQNRGLLRTNNQMQVANRLGDILGTNATRTVGNAAKDACTLILADWQAHGRLASQPASTATQQPTQEAHPAVATGVSATPATVVAPAVDVPVQKQPTPSDAEAAATREKQLKACQELAKDNPSITCK